ncbi:MAG: tRNA glutamyl-Q(34) synthetase GluQRS [Gammaproteobacteria bacterium]|nr:tRNA glutamyl-Q(34) synthetase GluQRS [Gammaproteobacteria bacterium]
MTGHADTRPTAAGTTPEHAHRGRFAPSPTGHLHFGSLVAAVGSFLEARARAGEWYLRIDDIDGPRTVPGASDSILRDLERFGLEWDGAVRYQSARIERYREALELLDASGWTFPCGCSRKDFARIYPGTCREGLPPGKRARTRRMRVGDTSIALEDRVQGLYRQPLGEEVGDFVVRRADGVYAYHLAAVVDDADEGVDEIVRGADLLASTPRQMHLQRCLGLPTPRYAHLPVAVNSLGQKLSKQTFAEPVSARDPAPLLVEVLEFLGQAPAAELRRAPLAELWAWAIDAWRLDAVPRCRAILWPGGKRARMMLASEAKEKE